MSVLRGQDSDVVIPGTSVTALSVPSDHITIALTSDYNDRVGRLIKCDLPAGTYEELFKWTDAASGFVIGSGSSDRIVVSALKGPGLNLDTNVTSFELDKNSVKSKAKFRIDAAESAVLSIHPVKSGIVGLLSDPGTSRLIVRSITDERTLFTIPDVPGNLAHNPIRVSLDGQYLVFGTVKANTDVFELTCWSILDGRQKWSVHRGYSESVSGLCFVNTNRLLVGTNKGALYLCDIASGKVLCGRTLDGSGDDAPLSVQQCASDSLGKRVAIRIEGAAFVFNVTGEDISLMLTVRRKGVGCITLSDDGQALVLGATVDTGCRIERIEIR